MMKMHVTEEMRAEFELLVRRAIADYEWINNPSKNQIAILDRLRLMLKECMEAGT